MATHPFTTHPRRASMPPRPHSARPAVASGAPGATPNRVERNAAIGLVCALPVSLALWAGIIGVIRLF